MLRSRFECLCLDDPPSRSRRQRLPARRRPTALPARRSGAGRGTGQGGNENERSTDVESPPPHPRVRMNVQPESKSCYYLSSSACAQCPPCYTGAKTEAWYLLIHADASLSMALMPDAGGGAGPKRGAEARAPKRAAPKASAAPVTSKKMRS